MRTASTTIPLCMSHSCRIRLREVRGFARPALERRQRARRVHVNDRVELVGEPRAEVMARALRLGLVDDANRALESRPGERLPCIRRAKHKALESCVVKQAFVAALQ